MSSHAEITRNASNFALFDEPDFVQWLDDVATEDDPEEFDDLPAERGLVFAEDPRWVH